MLSRPRREQWTSPAPLRTCKCLVTACRVTEEPSVRLVIERGPREESWATMAKRVSSPSAANTGAELLGLLCSLGGMSQMFFDQLDHRGPTLLVGRERLGAACQRDLVEAGLGDREHRSLRNFLQDEFDQSSGFGGVIDAPFHREGMPAERE